MKQRKYTVTVEFDVFDNLDPFNGDEKKTTELLWIGIAQSLMVKTREATEEEWEAWTKMNITISHGPPVDS